MYYPFIVIKTKQLYKKIENIYSINKEKYRNLLSKNKLNIDDYHIVSDVYLPINDTLHDILLVHDNISEKAVDYIQLGVYKNKGLYQPKSQHGEYKSVGLVYGDIEEDYYLIHLDFINNILKQTKSDNGLESISMYNFLNITSDRYNTINLSQSDKLKIKNKNLELIETREIIDDHPMILYLNETDRINYTKFVFIIVIIILLFLYSRRR